MSEIRIKYPVVDMTPLVERATLPDVPHRAHWWRIRVYPTPDGIAYETRVDNIDALDPESNEVTTVTYRWGDDGRNEIVEPHAVRLVTNEDYPDIGRDYSIFRAVPYTAIWIDVLCGDAPTTNPKWEPLTTAGNHRHPADLDEIARQRTEMGLLPIWAGLGG